ncbi:hypothetical protein D3C73_1461980 [compost metagenome]
MGLHPDPGGVVPLLDDLQPLHKNLNGNLYLLIQEKSGDAAQHKLGADSQIEQIPGLDNRLQNVANRLIIHQIPVNGRNLHHI